MKISKPAAFNFTGEVFSGPEDLINRFDDYIDYLNDNPLKEEKLYGGEGETALLDKMRAPSLEGFSRFLRISKNRLMVYKSKDGDWGEAFAFIEDSIYSITYEGASAGLLKEAIVTRKLGLADKIETSNVTRKVVLLHAPDNQRQVRVAASDLRLIEEAEIEDE